MLILGCGATPPKDNTDYKNIIGKTIKINNLEIAQYDFPYNTDWVSAKNSCRNMGDGWRLPTRSELNILYQNKIKIGNFKNNNYWSSTVFDEVFACFQYFGTGYQSKYGDMDYAFFIRPVRSL